MAATRSGPAKADLPVQPVEQPILCSPYEEPTPHRTYDMDMPKPGRRRNSSTVLAGLRLHSSPGGPRFENLGYCHCVLSGRRLAPHRVTREVYVPKGPNDNSPWFQPWGPSASFVAGWSRV